MVLVIVGEDQDVVHVNNTENINQTFQHGLHEGLEHCWCVCHPEQHDQVLKIAVSCLEHTFLFITLLDLDLVVYVTEVNLQEDFCCAEPIKELPDQQ